MSDEALAAPAVVHPLVTCHACEREVPDGEFCGACGAHLYDTAPAGVDRRHHFAAHPGEQVLHLSVISTMLPHLPHRQAGPFRIALVGGAVLLVALGLLDLTGPAIAAASVIVPILYLMYLYEVEVYEDEPVIVIGGTFAVGAVLGLPWAFLTGPMVTQALLNGNGRGTSGLDVVTIGILLPILGQVVMLAGALLIYFTRRYDEALDGFSFGAAAALGFTFTTTLVLLFPELEQGLFSETPPFASALQVIQTGLLIPLIYASTTGLIAGALWLRRGRVRVHAAQSWTTSLIASIAVALAVQVALALVGLFVTSSLVSVLAYLMVAILLLLWVRVALHHMLLSEAVDVTIGPDGICSHCHKVVPRMAFCPSCGIATRATPKSGAGRAGRAVR